MSTEPTTIIPPTSLQLAPRPDAPVPHQLDPADIYVVAAPVVQTIDVEKYGDRPRRERGWYRLHDAESLVGYVQRHRIDAAELGGEGRPEIFADIDSVSIVAVLNPHDDCAGPGWHDWTASLTLRPTPEWNAWKQRSGQLLGQVTFAEHIEEHLDDIVEPAAADLLEIARTFEAKTNVAFRSAVTLESGARQLTYNEQIDARAGAEGSVVVPARFSLGVVPFDGSNAYRVEARLRYRIADGKLTIGYELVRPDLVERAAFDEAVAKVSADTGLTVHHGVFG